MNKLGSFSKALEAVKHGGKVQRAGWNGKGMHLVKMDGFPDGVPANEETRKKHGLPDGAVVKVDPYLAMFTATGSIVPWLASQSDLLSDDWVLVGSDI